MRDQEQLSHVSVGEYLAARLHQLGVDHLFGVPGDFNLTLLDEFTSAGLQQWVTSSNELGAGYACDAYARKRGLGALVTTYGVGELSCLNAVAGAAAEHVPLLQITGSPSQHAALSSLLIHHTLADGDFHRFERMYQEITCAAEVLELSTATEQIDHVLSQIITHRRPGYLSVPTDLAAAPVDGSPLKTPLKIAPSDGIALASFAHTATRLMNSARQPVAVVGHIADRFGASAEVLAFLETQGLPAVVLPSARGTIPEGHPLYRGVYAGTMVNSESARRVTEADVVVYLGVVMSDVLTGNFSHRSWDENSIELCAREAWVGPNEFPDVGFLDALRNLNASASTITEGPSSVHGTLRTGPARKAVGGLELTQKRLWNEVGGWIPAGSPVIADIGTAYWGVMGEAFPARSELISQPIWNSIGYALPAVLGQGLAEPGRRPVLLIGDGAAQMTVQDISAIHHAGIAPIVILINNDGYTIERAIQSPEASYNTITPWNWGNLISALTENKALTYRARTVRQLRDALTTATSATDSLVFIEAFTARDDTPPLLQELIARLR